MLGVELGEEFEVKGRDEKFVFETSGLKMIKNNYHGAAVPTLYRLLRGTEEIARRPWRPKKGKEYWSVFLRQDGSWYADSYCYDGDVTDLSSILAGNCFPTQEAAEAAAPDIVKFYEDVRKMVEE